MNISEKERLREAAQLCLEHGIPASERNKKGQFATPYRPKMFWNLPVAREPLFRQFEVCQTQPW